MYLAPYTELVSVSFAIAAIFMMPNTAIVGVLYLSTAVSLERTTLYYQTVVFTKKAFCR